MLYSKTPKSQPWYKYLILLFKIAIVSTPFKGNYSAKNIFRKISSVDTYCRNTALLFDCLLFIIYKIYFF